MRKLILLFVLCAGSMFTQPATAQVSLNLNISSQPIWGPVGYNHVEYYYLPEIDAYYSVPTRTYYYMENGYWVNRSYLPARYRNYDLYRGRKIVINEARPYLQHTVYRTRYARSNEGRNQQIIRDSRDERYFAIKEHPEHSKYRGNQVVTIHNNNGQNARYNDNRGQNNDGQRPRNNDGRVNNSQNQNQNQKVVPVTNTRNQPQNTGRNNNPKDQKPTDPRANR
jgi:hypothetical protein